MVVDIGYDYYYIILISFLTHYHLLLFSLLHLLG